MYCKSGRVKLLDTEFSNPRLSALDVSLSENDRVAIRVDYDKLDVPRISGEIFWGSEAGTGVSVVAV